MSEYGIIDKEILIDIADAVRSKTGKSAQIKVSELAQEIEDIETGGGDWTRPAGAPNLDALTDWQQEGFEGVYLTYKIISGTDNYISLYCTTNNSSSYTVEIGHISGSSFVSDDDWTATSGSYFTQSISNVNADYVVFRISPNNDHFTVFNFGKTETTISGKAIEAPYYYQQCIERVGRLPYVTSLTNNSTSSGYGCVFLERDCTVVGEESVVTNITSAWQYCYSLQSLEVSDWDTSNWTISSLQNTWNGCSSLKTLDLSDWDISNWNVTSASSAWSNCTNLVNYYPLALGCSQHYATAYKLSYASIMRLLNGCPTLSTSKTITLGNLRCLLEDSEIAIATNKGWTIA